MLDRTEFPKSVKSNLWGTQSTKYFCTNTIIKLELLVLELWNCGASLAWLKKKKISICLRQLLCANEELAI